MSTGFKHVVGSFTFEPMLTYSNAKEDRVYDNVLAFRNSTGGTGPITIDWSSFDFNAVKVDPAIDVPSKYSLRRTREDGGLVEEDTSPLKSMSPGIRTTCSAAAENSKPASSIRSAAGSPIWSHIASCRSATGISPPFPRCRRTSVYNDRFQSGFQIDHFPNVCLYQKQPGAHQRRSGRFSRQLDRGRL